jgi:hypothetical protein
MWSHHLPPVGLADDDPGSREAGVWVRHSSTQPPPGASWAPWSRSSPTEPGTGATLSDEKGPQALPGMSAQVDQQGLGFPTLLSAEALIRYSLPEAAGCSERFVTRTVPESYSTLKLGVRPRGGRTRAM